MTLENVSIASYITDKLRNNITDPNSANRQSQFGQWIYPDRPKIVKLLNDKNNFPRISVETTGGNTVEDIGMDCLSQLENAPLKINVWTVRDLVCTVTDTSAESHTYVTDTNVYELTNLPISVISLVTGTLSGIPHTFSKSIDYDILDNDMDGFYDSISWLGVDIPDNDTDFLVSYQRKASADELCRFIAQGINKYLRENWRLWDEHIVWNYKKTGATPIDLDNELGVYRFELIISFDGIDLGDSI